MKILNNKRTMGIINEVFKLNLVWIHIRIGVYNTLP